MRVQLKVIFFCNNSKNTWGPLSHMVIQAHLSKMRAVFSEIRENSPSNAEGDEAITFAMLEEKINSPTVQQLLETLGFLDQNLKSSKCKAHGTVHGGVLNV